eukprot:4858716-Amphidinium_carterae.1
MCHVCSHYSDQLGPRCSSSSQYGCWHGEAGLWEEKEVAMAGSSSHCELSCLGFRGRKNGSSLYTFSAVTTCDQKQHDALHAFQVG